MSPLVSSPRRVAADRTRTRAGRSATLRPPRRLSGPVGGLGRGAQAAPRPRVALGDRALAVVRGLPDHSVIDRLVRGRVWIPLLGVLLAGIVAMQVEILKLGTTMGQAMERSSALQTRNEALQASVATLGDDQRIERLAAGMGMTMPAPTSLTFLSPRPGAIGRALGGIHTPDPAAFTSQLAAQAAAAAALAPAAPAATSATTAPSSVAATATPTSAATTTTTSSTAAPSVTTASPSATTTGQSDGAAVSSPVTPAASSSPSGTPSSTGAAGIAPPASQSAGGG